MGKYKEVKGHHVPAKAALKGHPDYNTLINNAPSVPYDKLQAANSTKEGSKLHDIISGNQRSYYAEFSKEYLEAKVIRENPSAYTKDQVKAAMDLETVTWDHIREVEIDAHVASGFSEDQAAKMVDHGIAFYKNEGVAQPYKIPWGPQLR